MGIYLPDMEMPKNCYNCWLGHKCPKYEALLWNEINKERKADCPLVPVPPHGRLGDLDELKERATKRLYASNHGSMAEAYYASIIDLIDSAPTIIPAEEGET
jgi:hypothetical protein